MVMVKATAASEAGMSRHEMLAAMGFEADDFGKNFMPELRKQEERLRAKSAKSA